MCHDCEAADPGDEDDGYGDWASTENVCDSCGLGGGCHVVWCPNLSRRELVLYGWQCVACERVNSPAVVSCPCSDTNLEYY